MPEVYMFDMLDQIPQGVRSKMYWILKDYFGRIHAAGGPDMRTWWWSWDVPGISPLDIIIYFLPSGRSVVKQLDPNFHSSRSHQGLTVGTSPRASEVYVQYDPTVNANLAFHEMMHMKLRMGDAMHNLEKQGLAISDVSGQTLSSKDITLMAAALKNPVAQWPDGIQILGGIKAKIAAGSAIDEFL